MTVRVGIEVQGTKELDKLIRKIALRGGNLAPVFRGPIDKSVSMLFRRQFDSEGAFGGRKWAPHSKVTARVRLRPGGARGGILHDFGRLRGSLEKVGPESIRVVGRDRYERGTTVPYARWHQLGYTIRKWGKVRFKRPRRVPARPIIPDPLPRPVVASWMRVIQRWVNEGRL